MKIFNYGIALLFVVTLWGCGQSNSSAPVTIDPTTNRHPAGWAVNGTGGAHPAAYFAAQASCESCHGRTNDPKGGISGVSCSNPGRSGVACHPSFPHAVGFSAYSRHGSVAKDTASGVTGMAHCKQCHGSNYTGSGSAPSCIKCHNDNNNTNHAPHAANWVAGNANGLKHSTTVENNAPACFQCHAGGAYSHPAPVPPPAGTAPGCFNGTMCHNAAGHTFTVAGHMLPAASNIASCQPCHATPASGSNPSYTVPKNALLSPNGCENCHYKVSGTPSGLAHPYMWVPGRGNPGQQSASHANAGTVNASCSLCHGGVALAGGGSGPSCFPASPINGTGCHFTKPVDAQGVTVGCVSCHFAPPSSTAPPTTLAPNRAYGHTNHWAIPGIATNGSCGNCHSGSGYGTAVHADGTTQTSAMPAKFQNVAGTSASYDSATGTCSNVSCHGQFGFAFQPWTDTLSVIFDPFDPTVETCTNCHLLDNTLQPSATGVPTPFPYIGPYSGKNTGGGYLNLHFRHVQAFGKKCTDCHVLTVHFNSLMQGRRFLQRGFAAPSVGNNITSYSYNSTTGISSCSTSLNGCHIVTPINGNDWYQ